MKFFAVLAVVLLAGAVAADHDEIDFYEGQMDGTQCVPISGLEGGSWGTVGIAINWDEEIAYLHSFHSLTTEGLGRPQLFMGPASASGDLVFTFDTDGSLGEDSDSGASPIVGSIDFSDNEWTQEQETQFRLALSNGDTYIQLTGPEGTPYAECAIRGQLAYVPPLGVELEFEGELSGLNEVPTPANTTASGDASAEYDPQHGYLDLKVKWKELQGNLQEKGIHLHVGAAGFNGAKVLYVPFDDPEDNDDGDAEFKEVFINQFVAAQMALSFSYVNVHTDQFTGGEIRGQLFNEATRPDDAASSLAVTFGAALVALAGLLL